jgi:hypothetical protein
MPIHRGSFGGSVNLKPTASITSADQNQDRAILYGSVNAQGASTTVEFQYSTDSGFGSYSTATATQSPVTGFSNTTVSVTITGLANATTYYYRIVATNSIGTTTTSSGSFKTWGLIQYANGTPGSYGVAIPVGAGTAPTLRYVFIYGGGGGAGYAGGGGGGYRLRDSYVFSGTNGVITVLVGGGGGGVGGAGGTSYISGANLTTLDAGGGGGGGTGYGSSGGNVGYGDNPGYAGGTGAAVYNKDGSILEHANGGGGGIGGAGGNSYGSASTQYGGAGGTGGTAYGWNGGAGGGGYGSLGTGGNGAYHGWGSGGQGINGGGSSGLVTFYYYGAV